MLRFFICFLLLHSITTYAQNDKAKAQQLIKNKDYIAAKNILLSLQKTNANDVEVLELLGDTYGYLQHWDKAIETYKILVKKNPKSANYHYKYGGSLGRKAQLISKFKAISLIGDVKDELILAADLDPNHIEVRWALVDLYVSLPAIVGGSLKKALKYANQLEQLSKLDGYLAKGYIYEYDDEVKLASNYYKMAAELSKNINCSSNLQRNDLRYQIGKMSASYKLSLEKGSDCLTSYIKNLTARDGVPKHWAYYRLAQIHRHKKLHSKALQYIEKALVLQPNFKQGLNEKARIKALM